jgi:superfamily II DNA/RNA helicase
MEFTDLGLSPEVLRGVADAGHVTPTPIQEQAIPYVLMGRDVMGCAQTGTGKTGSFVLPMLDILATGRAKARMPRCLILEPTRELAAQVADNFEVYGKYHKLSMALLIGGVSFADQDQKLDRGVDVLIATPGRLLDHFGRGKVLLGDVKILVIDEGDRMLDMGFIPDVERIVSLMPKIRQTLMFSATMLPEVRRLAGAFLMNPKKVAVAPPASAAETVTQHVVVVDHKDKREALRQLVRSENVRNALVFCNRKRDIGVLARSLQRHGFNAESLHGDMGQPQRMEVLQRFKQGDIRLLVCSDVAARGLDIVFLSHVFNFDVPVHPEDYVHRIGRTGRAGRDGRAFAIATPEDTRMLARIAQLIGNEIPRIELPTIGAISAETPATPARERARGPKPRGTGRRDRPARAERAADSQDANPGGPVVGLGDHVPAFLMRSVPQIDSDTGPKRAARAESA